MHSLVRSCSHQSNFRTAIRASTFLLFGTFTACHLLLLHTCRPVSWSGDPSHWGSRNPGPHCSMSLERKGFLHQIRLLHSQTPAGSRRGVLLGRCRLPSGSERREEKRIYVHVLELLFFLYCRIHTDWQRNNDATHIQSSKNNRGRNKHLENQRGASENEFGQTYFTLTIIFKKRNAYLQCTYSLKRWLRAFKRKDWRTVKCSRAEFRIVNVATCDCWNVTFEASFVKNNRSFYQLEQMPADNGWGRRTGLTHRTKNNKHLSYVQNMGNMQPHTQRPGFKPTVSCCEVTVLNTASPCRPQ